MYNLVQVGAAVLLSHCTAHPSAWTAASSCTTVARSAWQADEMENDGFWVRWFSSGSAHWNSCPSCPSTVAVHSKHTLWQGMQGKDEGDTHLEPCSSRSPAAQVQCQTELNSKSKEDLARNVAPSHHLGATRATSTSSSSMGFTESSMEPEHGASSPPFWTCFKTHKKFNQTLATENILLLHAQWNTKLHGISARASQTS